jgi:hypothetical protein
MHGMIPFSVAQAFAATTHGFVRSARAPKEKKRARFFCRLVRQDKVCEAGEYGKTKKTDHMPLCFRQALDRATNGSAERKFA